MTCPACRSSWSWLVIVDSCCILFKVLEEKEHKLNGRTIDPKRANPRREVCKKIFVGKCEPTTPEADIKEYFSKFGKVNNCLTVKLTSNFDGFFLHFLAK